MRWGERWSLRLAVVAALAACIAAPAAAGEDAIESGVDLWTTVGAGVTYTSFVEDPIPADFFCQGSRPFAGKIAFGGQPVSTTPCATLASTDTIVHRIERARFDEQGVARTRIRLLALSLQSVEPIETDCGRYDVAAALDGEQPTTEMRIVRTSAAGGTYEAPLALNVKLVFTPVGGDPAGRRELSRHVELGSGTQSVWSYSQPPAYWTPVTVDTDGDLMPDTPLPKPSNFLAGTAPFAPGAVVPAASIAPLLAATGATPIPACPVGRCPYRSCHCTAWSENPDPFEPNEGCTYLHCVWVCVPCEAIPATS
jgi:hypothetical protein